MWDAMKTSAAMGDLTTLACSTVVCLTSAALMLFGCSGGDSKTTGESSGGAQAVGGAAATGGGGGTSTGGATLAGVGGTTSSGGATGGTSATGVGGTTPAAPVTGGKPATGGTGATGGSSASPATTGGTVATGGTSSSGGAKSTGGTQTTGGTATGGTSAVKTSEASSGGVTTGGNTSTGGASAGGQTAGGGTKTSGGTASGGASSSGTDSITIWMAGDSTMMNCSSSCPCGWGSQFGSYFNSSVTVQNQAVGGRSIQTWLYESAVSSTMGTNGECTLSSSTYDTRWTTLLSSIKVGDYLMIDFGINDGDTTCPRHVGTERFKTLLDTMVKGAKDKGALPVLLTPTDAITCSGSTVTENRGFLTETQAVATADNVPLIDLNQLSMDLYKRLAFCPNSEDYTSTTSNLGKFFCDDHTHFEAAGANQIAGLVANALKTQGIGLAAYLK